MIQLNSPSQQPYSEIPYIGITISGDLNQRHIGLIFRTNQAHAPRMLHLAFHNRLSCDTEPLGYWMHCSGFSEAEQLQLAVWFEKIWTVNKNRIPYGLAYSSTGHFDSVSGAFVPSEKGSGLTCASFVMALFEDFAFPVIDADSWQARACDAQWQGTIVESLRKDMERHPDFYTESHLNDQIANIGIAVRFRPEEVAAAAHLFVDTAMTFERAEPLGVMLLDRMGIHP